MWVLRAEYRASAWALTHVPLYTHEHTQPLLSRVFICVECGVTAWVEGGWMTGL